MRLFANFALSNPMMSCAVAGHFMSQEINPLTQLDQMTIQDPAVSRFMNVGNGDENTLGGGSYPHRAESVASEVMRRISYLDNEDKRICLLAIQRLGDLGDSRAVEPLSACLRDGNEDIQMRKEAARSLRRIGSSSAIAELKRAQKYCTQEELLEAINSYLNWP